MNYKLELQAKEERAALLAQGYTKSKRMLEIFSISSFFLLFGFVTLRIAIAEHEMSVWSCLLAIFAGYIAADFVSGLFHWAADTWGSVEWPIVGNTLIRSFREHHVDQKAITRHDFIETNGDNCLVCLPVLIGLAVFDPNGFVLAFAYTVTLSMLFWTFLTNQIHKWSHQDEVPVVVELLQKAKIILCPRHHEKHHTFPHTSHYCITSGWLNTPLAKIRFFRIFEAIITKVTGAQPRGEDLKLVK